MLGAHPVDVDDSVLGAEDGARITDTLSQGIGVTVVEIQNEIDAVRLRLVCDCSGLDTGTDVRADEAPR